MQIPGKTMGDNLEDSRANDGQKVTVLQRIPLMN